MPGCPLRNTCVRPSWLTGLRDQRPPRGGLIADLVLGDRVSPVGAGLLAKRPEHSTYSSTVPSPSRASSLPHGIGNDLQICGHCKSLWEQSLLAMAVDQLASALDVPPSSRASFAPTDLTGVRAGEPGRLSGRLAFDLDLGRPVNHAGRTQALWSGHPGMDAGIAALGHGWPFAAAHGAMPAFGHAEPRRGTEWWG